MSTAFAGVTASVKGSENAEGDCCVTAASAGGDFTDTSAKIDNPPGDMPVKTIFPELSIPTKRVSST